MMAFQGVVSKMTILASEIQWRPLADDPPGG